MENYICVDCYSQEEDEDGCCINGHDNWLELSHDILLLKEVSDKFNVSMEEIVKILIEGSGEKEIN